MLERIGFDRMPPAAVVECDTCGLSMPIAKAGAWPRIVVLPAKSHLAEYARTPLRDALGVCPTCAKARETAFVPAMQTEPEPQRNLFA